MSTPNAYPEDNWMLVFLLLAIFGFISLWQSWKVRTFFSKTWNLGQEDLPISHIRNALGQLSGSTPFGFSMMKHTTLVLGNVKIPVIFGSVHYPLPRQSGVGQSSSKAFFTLSEIGTMTALLKKYPEIFSQACENGKYMACWIKNMARLEKEFHRNKPGPL